MWQRDARVMTDQQISFKKHATGVKAERGNGRFGTGNAETRPPLLSPQISRKCALHAAKLVLKHRRKQISKEKSNNSSWRRRQTAMNNGGGE
jgi:hypothetical protein